MRGLSLFLLGSWLVLAQDPEAGRIVRNGSSATLIVDSPRPLDSAAITLAQEFGIRVNVEDPFYLFSGDIKDATATVSRDPSKPVYIPAGGRLEVQFPLNANGAPADTPALLRLLVDAANAKLPFAWRLDIDSDWYTIAPTNTRDASGHTTAFTPLLDRRITISPGTRPIHESARLMANALSAQTGLRVDCCQAFIAGFPWGMTQVFFEANNEPARSILKRLISAAAANQSAKEYWLQRCSPSPSAFCFIDLRHLPR
jgi:hypothetical protein